VAGERRGEDVVLALEARQHQLPGAPGVGEPVQEDERRAGPAAVRGTERAGHRARASGGGVVPTAILVIDQVPT